MAGTTSDSLESCVAEDRCHPSQWHDPSQHCEHGIDTTPGIGPAKARRLAPRSRAVTDNVATGVGRSLLLPASSVWPRLGTSRRASIRAARRMASVDSRTSHTSVGATRAWMRLQVRRHFSFPMVQVPFRRGLRGSAPAVTPAPGRSSLRVGLRSGSASARVGLRSGSVPAPGRFPLRGAGRRRRTPCRANPTRRSKTVLGADPSGSST